MLVMMLQLSALPRALYTPHVCVCNDVVINITSRICVSPLRSQASTSPRPLCSQMSLTHTASPTRFSTCAAHWLGYGTVIGVDGHWECRQLQHHHQHYHHPHRCTHKHVEYLGNVEGQTVANIITNIITTSSLHTKTRGVYGNLNPPRRCAMRLSRGTYRPPFGLGAMCLIRWPRPVPATLWLYCGRIRCAPRGMGFTRRTICCSFSLGARVCTHCCIVRAASTWCAQCCSVALCVRGCVWAILLFLAVAALGNQPAGP